MVALAEGGAGMCRQADTHIMFVTKPTQDSDRLRVTAWYLRHHRCPYATVASHAA